MRKKSMIIAGSCLIMFILAIILWNMFFSTTKIAFINYQIITLGQISKANDNERVKIHILDVEDLDKLNSYDMVLMNGMGLRITAEQHGLIEAATNKGLPFVTTMATNPANNFNTLDSVAENNIKAYLAGGGRNNYKNMLNYIRHEVDGKKGGDGQIMPPAIKELKQFYHIDPINPDDEELEFAYLSEYECFLSKHNISKNEHAPAIIVTGQMGDPTDLIKELENTGNKVYPVRDMRSLIMKRQIDSIKPDAVINMAHGRMGDFIVDYLKIRNVPLFCPLNVNSLVQEWEDDKMGMSGGFMSQSIVVPEIDGAIRPYALFGHYYEEDGLQHLHAIPGRLETFVSTVNNHIVLKDKPNSDKKVVIYYYKGPGQSALSAAGMEVNSSLYKLLVRMKEEGYAIENLPASSDSLSVMIQEQGSVFNAYAEGAKADFLNNANPLLITAEEYGKWTSLSLRPELVADVVALDGEFPGSYISTSDGKLALPHVDLGNVVLMPQLAAGAGDDDFAIVHGTDAAPPHAYVASYLWAQHGFEADVIVHFGTHGSLEFTPKKQVALCDNDWPDVLVGDMPHLYIYSIGDVGEGVIAKRRSYATLQSHLTPPFMESKVRTIYKDLCDAINNYNELLYDEEQPDTKQAALKVKELTVQLGIHRELRLDSVVSQPYNQEEISRIETFAEELANEKVTGELYTMGVPYSEERIISTVFAMTTEPIAYSLLALDKSRGKASSDLEKHKSLFTRQYIEPSRRLVEKVLDNKLLVNDELICETADISEMELHLSREILQSMSEPQGMMAMMHSKKHPAKEKKSYSKDEIEFSRLVMEIERTLKNINNYKKALEDSPEIEMLSLLNAMDGGYTAPSPGGDPIVNPNTIPTGRNLYAINAEATPSEEAWKKGIDLANKTIEMYRKRHNDSIPRKVSYTLWSGEFIETEGATIAQILYMLGVEPIRDVFGRVTDIRLIPSEQLARPRIDVVVQTSGQLRDIAASRLFLISRAVEMAANAKEDLYDNYVRQGVVDAETKLIEKGLSPKQARQVSTYRVFGGINGGYGTGITGMVQEGDTWENSSEIAEIYLRNMGAFYGNEKDWEQMQQFAFEAALTNTDAVIQPRQSNTWGALSLDHVYEFMGGMNLAVRNVTGKEPDAYLSDYRNHHNMRMQELKEAIGIESRTTIFNPHYIEEKMKGEAGAAATFAEIVQNTYGWNVMKPETIDDEMWDEIYNVYVKDKFNLNVVDFFERQSPAALQEMTAVMMETARKGMWNATDEQLNEIARLHTDLIKRHDPSCSDFVCDNPKLREFLASKLSREDAVHYENSIREIREAKINDNKSMLMKKEELNKNDQSTAMISNTVVAILTLVALIILIILVRMRRKKMQG